MPNMLEEKIKNREITLAVIGLGYVGLPLCIEFSKSNIKVVGIDTDKRKIDSIAKKESYISDISSEELKECVEKYNFSATTDYSILKECDAVSICVPTPLRKTKDPDMSFINASISEIKKYVHEGMLVVLESTTYPGTTEELILPELEKSGLKVGKDYFLAFSPERIDPANPVYQTRNTPKVIGGVTPRCTELASKLYGWAVENIVPVSSTRAAEFVKLLENTFRAINIGLVNELSQVCDRLNLDVWEIIEAAKTKPFGYMPFYPGPGLGGHCIPIDPLYLTWKLKALNFSTRFINLADEINSNMPRYVANKCQQILNTCQKSLNGSKVLLLGAAYKKNINDYRESPALDIMALLEQQGAKVIFNDDLTGDIKIADKQLSSQKLTKELLKDQDLVVVATNHDYYDYEMIVENADYILDTRNALNKYTKWKLPSEDKATCHAKVYKI